MRDPGYAIKQENTVDPHLVSRIAYRVSLIDPYDGQKDLDKKIIRAVGNPNERFSEDALRMMRAIRIAAELSFTIEEKTFQAIKNNAGLIGKIAKERIKDELLKIFGSPHPYKGMVIFRNAKLMEEILPEMMKMQPKIEKNLDLENILSEDFSEDKNPDWEKVFEDSPD